MPHHEIDAAITSYGVGPATRVPTLESEKSGQGAEFNTGGRDDLESLGLPSGGGSDYGSEWAIRYVGGSVRVSPDDPRALIDRRMPCSELKPHALRPGHRCGNALKTTSRGARKIVPW